MTDLTLTMIFEEAEEGGFIGYVAELPGTNTQGETLEEVRENLSQAIQLILNANREQFDKNFSSSARVTRERLILSDARWELMQKAATDELFLADLNATIEDFGYADQEEHELLTMDRLAR